MNSIVEMKMKSIRCEDALKAPDKLFNILHEFYEMSANANFNTFPEYNKHLIRSNINRGCDRFNIMASRREHDEKLTVTTMILMNDGDDKKYKEYVDLWKEQVVRVFISRCSYSLFSVCEFIGYFCEMNRKDAFDMGLDFGYDSIDIIKENTESTQTDKSVRDIIYDIMYKHIKPKLDKNVEMGGYSINGSDSELFYWALKYSSLDYYHILGSRLFKDGNCWKIYSGYHMVEHYNIIVHFNDNDKITNVEWIEDSKFNPFDKEFMYSIYEDLKKYEIPKPSKDDTEEFDEPTDEEINETIEECYPFCIIKDRYSGTYSGGKYTAWVCGIDFIPDGILDDDVTCAYTWSSLKKCREIGEIVYGVGNTPDEATKDLARAIIINNKKNEEDEE